MPRHRRMLAPINTIKHYVHRTNVVVATGARNIHVVADSVVAPATANAFDVKEGSIIKAIHFEYWVIGSGASGNNTQFIFVIEKVPVNTPSISAAEMLNLGAYINKKNILFTSHGVMGMDVDGQGGIPLIRSWLMIPKGKQRMGLSDRIVVSTAAVGVDLNVCGLVVYKEYI